MLMYTLHVFVPDMHLIPLMYSVTHTLKESCLMQSSKQSSRAHLLMSFIDFFQDKFPHAQSSHDVIIQTKSPVVMISSTLYITIIIFSTYYMPTSGPAAGWSVWITL